MSTTADTASAASPAVAYAFVIGLTAASWYGLWRYARPAIRSQAGRPTRMTRDRRLRTIAFSVLVMIYPLMFTAGCVMMAFQPTGDAGIWTANLMVWAMAAALITAPLLGLLALVSARSIGIAPESNAGHSACPTRRRRGGRRRLPRHGASSSSSGRSPSGTWPGSCSAPTPSVDRSFSSHSGR